LQSSQDAPCEGAEPSWPGVSPWIKQAANRIEVVTEHAGAIGGKSMHKLGVRMIDDMEYVEPIPPVLHKSWIDQESVQQAVEIERSPVRAEERESRAEAAKSRFKSFRVPKVFLEHFGAQIHAGPVFLREVGKNGESH
jgi:hypothetical protein